MRQGSSARVHARRGPAHLARPGTSASTASVSPGSSNGKGWLLRQVVFRPEQPDPMADRAVQGPCARRRALQQHRHGEACRCGLCAALAPHRPRVLAEQRVHPAFGPAERESRHSDPPRAVESHVRPRPPNEQRLPRIACDALRRAESGEFLVAAGVGRRGEQQDVPRARRPAPPPPRAGRSARPAVCASSTPARSHGAPDAAASTSGCFTKSIEAIAVAGSVHGFTAAGIVRRAPRSHAASTTPAGESEEPRDLGLPLVAETRRREDQHAGRVAARRSAAIASAAWIVLPRPTASASSRHARLSPHQRRRSRPLPWHERQIRLEQVPVPPAAVSHTCGGELGCAATQAADAPSRATTLPA